MSTKFGAAVVSILATLMFGATIILWMYRPPAANSEILSLLMGSLAAGYGAVINYWLGSSQSSANKDEAIKNLAAPTPVPGETKITMSTQEVKP